jgi:toxin-antitoxin system PIN domain toxin
LTLKTTEDAHWLLDVNALIALFDPVHVHNKAMSAWFEANSEQGWATCPITENGFIRIVSQPRYATGPYHVSDLIAALATQQRISPAHHFWTDALSLTDDSLFDSTKIAGSKQVTDAYLLGLAAKHNARLVSFDRNLPWQAIRNGSSNLIENPTAVID